MFCDWAPAFLEGTMFCLGECLVSKEAPHGTKTDLTEENTRGFKWKTTDSSYIHIYGLAPCFDIFWGSVTVRRSVGVLSLAIFQEPGLVDDLRSLLRDAMECGLINLAAHCAGILVQLLCYGPSTWEMATLGLEGKGNIFFVKRTRSTGLETTCYTCVYLPLLQLCLWHASA